jgi:hypothetical protein
VAEAVVRRDVDEDGVEEQASLERSVSASGLELGGANAESLPRTYKGGDIDTVIHAVRFDDDDSYVEAEERKDQHNGRQHPHDSHGPRSIASPLQQARFSVHLFIRKQIGTGKVLITFLVSNRDLQEDIVQVCRH